MTASRVLMAQKLSAMTGLADKADKALDELRKENPISEDSRRKMVVCMDIAWRKAVLEAVLKADSLAYNRLAGMAAYLCETDTTVFPESSEFGRCLKESESGEGQKLLRKIYNLFDLKQETGREELTNLLYQAARYSLNLHSKASKLLVA